VSRRSPALAKLPQVRGYHLVPVGASKARAVALHRRARGYARADCFAVGDSREDLGASEAVGTFWLVANALDRDASLSGALGPRVRAASGAYGAVFGVFLRQKLAGRPYTVVGDGSQTRDFTYVTDVAHAFLAAAQTPRVGRVYNLGAGKPQSVNRLVELLGGEKIRIPKRPGEPDCTWADISRITSELDWRPQVSFEEGVGKILADIDYWRSAPLWDPDSIDKATKTWFQYLSPER